MRVTRTNQRKNEVTEELKKQQRPHRKIRRLVKESDISRVTDVTNLLNAAKKFTYADIERNKGAINLIKHQIDQAISNYGLDLTYFRKYNTFFKEGEENHSNLIYGEDTTAQYYASGMIRAFVSVENMAWNFNQIGFEATEQITLFLSIENFEQAFIDKISKTETKYFEVPVSGNTINCEVTGMMKEPEFQAFVYGSFGDDLVVENAHVKMICKEVNDSFYCTRTDNTSFYNISGSLGGILTPDDQYPFVVHGVLGGELAFHNRENLEDSSTWKLAPQVGDYFKLVTPTGLDEEWEVTQIYDRNLIKGGINPLLGKYVYQISATRRAASYEKNTDDLNYREPGEDINELLGDVSSNSIKEADQYTVKKGENVLNKKTNQLGKNAYDYVDRSDEEYGGVQNKPSSK